MHTTFTLKSCRLDLITSPWVDHSYHHHYFPVTTIFFLFLQNISLPSKYVFYFSCCPFLRKMVETKIKSSRLQLKAFDNFPSLLEKKKDDLLGSRRCALSFLFSDLLFIVSWAHPPHCPLPLCHEGCLAALSQNGWTCSSWSRMIFI